MDSICDTGTPWVSGNARIASSAAWVKRHVGYGLSEVSLIHHVEPRPATISCRSPPRKPIASMKPGVRSSTSRSPV